MRGGKDGGREAGNTHLGPAVLSFSGTARREVLILLIAVVNKAADDAVLDRKAWWGGGQGVCGSRWGRKAWAAQRKSGSSRKNGARSELLLAILAMVCLYVCVWYLL